ncbi:MAG: beta-galactosidase trimerization domain-containing protein, partial [Anaerolineae bacterium]
PFYTSLQLDYARSPALHADKPFWLPEIESGPIGEWVLGPTHATTARDIRRHGLDSIAHGAKMMLYQGYREWDPLPLHWGALVDLNGEPTERYHEAARLSQVVLSHEALFLEAHPVRSQIGILVDQCNAIACQGMGAGAYLLQAIKGLYSAYWSQGYGVEFITPELLAEGKGAGYRLLLMPFLMLVTPACARAVKDFVAGGGTAVAFAKCGMLDDRSWYWRDRPGGLTDLFGATETCITKAEAVTLAPEPNTPVFDGISKPLRGHWHRQDFALDGDAEVLARYPDGAPGVTLKQHGQGRALLFGTHFDIASLTQGVTGHHRVFANLAAMAAVERPFRLSGESRLDGHLLNREGQTESGPWLFILINHSPMPATALVKLPRVPGMSSVKDLFAGRLLVKESGSDGLRFEVPLDGYRSTALLIEQ